MIVEIRPREQPTWHGKKADENFSRPITIVPAIDPSTMQYQVSLSDSEWKRLKSTGYDLSLDAKIDTPHPTWDGAIGAVKLEPNTMTFNTDNPIELIKLGVIRAAKTHVAPSLEEADNNSEYSKATHYIFSEEEDVAVKATKIQKKQEANKMLFEMPTEKQAAIATLVLGISTKSRSTDFIRTKADEAVETDPDAVLKWAKMKQEDFTLHTMIQELLLLSVLVKSGGAITWMGETLGYSAEEAIKYLKDPNNQAMRLKLLEIYKS